MLQGIIRNISSLISPTRTITMAAATFPELDIPTERATFAMGCFWAPEPIYGCKKGVIRTKVGYCGGTKENPTYRSLGDHTEAIQIEYDPTQTDYKTLLGVFWRQHDSTAKYKSQYKSAIYYENDEQKKLAEESKAEYQKELQRPIVTDIEKLGKFYDAENYHQKYHLREHVQFYDSLGLTDPALVRSHVATRLHGYIYGYGTLADFEDESKKWSLSEDQIAFVKKQMAHPRAIHCGL
ncbi:putative Peptide methionine sulfoxide reductase [Hypsibius exemplaris]|uniref:peptide-methionine (S)-S-oxide reductase n=1 Tax=Hypsibius exemplaris TaxID=2072580 RepID=A0A9X6RKU8_HYPEX|nr:putative Peptide methionine sulfoxide reductase [Hypsibius exemplaris]